MLFYFRLENYHLTVTLVKEEDGGEYEVRAENEFGSVSSKSTVTVHSKYSQTCQFQSYEQEIGTIFGKHHLRTNHKNFSLKNYSCAPKNKVEIQLQLAHPYESELQ